METPFKCYWVIFDDDPKWPNGPFPSLADAKFHGNDFAPDPYTVYGTNSSVPIEMPNVIATEVFRSAQD